MKARQTLLLLLVLPFSTSLTGAASAQPTSTDIVVGERETLFSETLSETRILWVGKPGGYERRSESYAVMIVLDGDRHFEHTVATTRFLARNDLIPEMLVVGVENTIRPRDLTPPSEDPADAESFPVRGGADAFQAFIADELIPWIDEHWRTRPFRILIGHSHGGLFAIYSLITRPDLFNGYIAISPSLQWDAQRYVDRAERFSTAGPSSLRACS